MTDFAYVSRRALPEGNTLAAITERAKQVVAMVREWHRRYRSRWELAIYSHHERCDFAHASEIDAEIAKPFWKA